MITHISCRQILCPSYMAMWTAPPNHRGMHAGIVGRETSTMIFHANFLLKATKFGEITPHFVFIYWYLIR